MLLALGNVNKTDDSQLGGTSHRVANHAGGSGERDIQHAVTEHYRINFAMRVRLAREEAKVGEVSKGRRNPSGFSVVLSLIEEAFSIAES